MLWHVQVKENEQNANLFLCGSFLTLRIFRKIRDTLGVSDDTDDSCRFLCCIL